jgi:hypothetical protein
MRSRHSIQSSLFYHYHRLTQALAPILHAITLTRGESAIMEVLEAAKARADEEYERTEMITALERAKEVSRRLMADQDTILSERGDQTILRDAFEDGSSLLCNKCGCLVPSRRSQEHAAFWCEFSTQELVDDEDT